MGGEKMSPSLQKTRDGYRIEREGKKPVILDRIMPPGVVKTYIKLDLEDASQDLDIPVSELEQDLEAGKPIIWGTMAKESME